MVKPGYKQTEIGVIPEEWKIATIGTIADVKTGPFGSALHADDYVEDGTPIITVEHLGETGLTRQNLPNVSIQDKHRLSAYTMREGDIVFSRVGSVDRNAYVTAAEDGWLFSGRILRLRAKSEEISPRYLGYYFKAEDTKERIRSVAVGQTMASLNTKLMDTFKVVLPAIEEQKKIAAFLSMMDDLICSLEKQLSKKKAIKQGAMQELLTGKKRLLGFSGEWKQYHLSEICQLINGRAYSQDELLPSGKYRVLRLGNLFTNGQWYYSDLELPEKQYCAKGDLIYAWSATFGPHIWEGEKVVYHYHIWKVELNALACKEYVYHYLRADVNTLMNELQGGTMAHLTKDTMEKRAIIMPEHDEQVAIAEILTNMDLEIAALEQKLAKYRQVKQGMMQQLLTGKIRLV